MSWLITPQQKNKGLLDTFTGAAAAYSLRDLTFLRGGPVIRVRRSSDSTEQDFTATQVTDGTLATFCGAGDGFVRTWYDQSGNGRHMSTTTSARQPRIVNSGTLRTDNTKPAIEWLTTFSILTFNRITNARYFFYLARCDINNIATSGLDSNARCFFGDTATIGPAQGGITAFTEIDGGLSFLNGVSTNLSSTTRNANQNLFTIGSNSNFAIDSLSFDRLAYLGRTWVGNIQEVIVYTSSQASQRSAIESAINAHYAIY